LNETFHTSSPLVEVVRKLIFGPECQNIQEIEVLKVDTFCIPHPEKDKMLSLISFESLCHDVGLFGYSSPSPSPCLPLSSFN
jgi:hypothetical protein